MNKIRISKRYRPASWPLEPQPADPRDPRYQAHQASVSMDTNTLAATDAALLNSPRTQHAFTTAKLSITVYGALTALGLVAASSGHPVNTFMWVRAVLLPAVAVLLYRMTVSASRGSRRAFERVRTLAILMPIAIVGIDLIPGVCPPWYAVMQAVCMLPIVSVAFITRRSATLFPGWLLAGSWQCGPGVAAREPPRLRRPGRGRPSAARIGGKLIPGLSARW